MIIWHSRITLLALYPGTKKDALYWVSHLLRGLGWVDLKFERSTVCPILPDGKLVEGAGQLYKMVKHQNQSHTSQGLRADWVPCSILQPS